MVEPLERGAAPVEHEVILKVDGLRLDQYLARHYTDFSRTVLRRAVEEQQRQLELMRQ